MFITDIKGNLVRYISELSVNSTGICVVGNKNYFCDITAGIIYLCDISMNEIKQFTSPDSGPRSIAFDGKNFYIACDGTKRIHITDKDFNSLRSFSYPLDLIRDISHDGKNLYILAEIDIWGTSLVYILDSKGEIIKTIDPSLEWLSGISVKKDIIISDWSLEMIYTYSKEFIKLTEVLSPIENPGAVDTDNKNIFIREIGVI